MALDLLTRLDPLRRLRCPHCFGEFAAFQTHIRCDSELCQTDITRHVEDPILTRTLTGRDRSPDSGRAFSGPWWTDPRHDPRRWLTGWLDFLILPSTLNCPYCEKPAGERLCPRCHRPLPDRVLEQRGGGSITIFGPQAVGKTTYLTVLLQEIKKTDDTPRRLGLRPLDDRVRQRYREEYYEITYGPPETPAARARHAPTVTLELDRRVLDPLVFELKTSAPGPGPLVSFCDLAGEDWEQKPELLRREGAHLIQRTRGLLFLIDPLRIPQVRSQMELTEEEATVRLADYVEDADKLADFFRRVPVRTPLAIVLNKIDRWGPLLSPETTLHQIARTPPGGENDPALDQIVHEEVRSALRHWGQTEFLDRLESDFPIHRFFACSALGDAAQLRSDQAPPLPTPLLVERAGVWLLERQGLLR